MGLRTKLFLPLAILLLLFTLYLKFSWHPVYLQKEVDYHKQHIKAHLNTLGNAMISMLLENDLASVYDTLEEVQRKNKSWTAVQLHHMDGTLLYPLHEQQINYENTNTWVITHTIKHMDDSLAVISLIYDGTSLYEHLSVLLSWIYFLMAAGMISLFISSGIILEFMVRRPLSRLVSAANLFRERSFDVALPKPGSDEVGALLRSFDLMRSNLQSYISRLTQSETDLLKISTQLQTLMDSSPTILLSAEVENDFRISFVSENVHKILGFEPEQITNNRGFWKEHIHPSDRSRFFPELPQAIRNGFYEEDFRLRDSQGIYRWVNCQLRISHDENNVVREIIGSITDINERRQSDEALRLIIAGTASATYEDFYRMLAKLLAEALEIKYAFISVYADEKKERMCTIAAWADNRFIQNFEVDLRCQQEKNSQVSAEMHCFLTELKNHVPNHHQLKETRHENYIRVSFADSTTGSLIGSIMALDVKPIHRDSRLLSIFQIFAARVGAELERQKSRRELLEYRDNLQKMVDVQTHDLIIARDNALSAERSMSGFLANMSHELRTPLHGIMSFSKIGLKKQGSAPDEKIKQYFTEIYDSGLHLLGLVNDLLDLSKLRAGKMVYSYESVQPYTVIEQVIAEMLQLANERNISISARTNSNARQIQLDKAKFAQVIRNLLSNAIKFSPANTEITIYTHYLDDIQIFETRICDEGVGIPESELETIFEAFMQSSVTNTAAGGTGLGLPICKEIIETGHAGTIRAIQREHGGTCFCIQLPAKQGVAIQKTSSMEL